MAPERQPRNLARVLAPLALAACALAVVIVIGSSLSGGDSANDSGAAADAADRQGETATAPQPRPQRARYTIKSGDTLGAIAEQTGVSVDSLQELNPEIDPQALIAGQKIKLR